jgi:hypothetical protein
VVAELAKLVVYVRARDLTCRTPDGDRPATDSDLDLTIPYDDGELPTSNLKYLCRAHQCIGEVRFCA